MKYKKVVGWAVSAVFTVFFLTSILNGEFFYGGSIFADAIKTVVLYSHPWKPIEKNLEEIEPESYAWVSHSTVYSQGKRSNLHISWRNKFTISDTKANQAQEIICDLLDERNKKYDKVILEITDLGFRNRKVNEIEIDCSVLK